MSRYNLYRQDSLRKQGQGVFLYVTDMDGEPVKNLWVNHKGQTSVGNVVVDVCYRLPEQEVIAYEAYSSQNLKKTSHLQLLDLMRNLKKHPDII